MFGDIKKIMLGDNLVYDFRQKSVSNNLWAFTMSVLDWKRK